LGLAFGLPLSWPVCLAIVVLASPTFSMENVATTLVLAASAPANVATALTLRSAGVCIGTALGGALGGGVLAVGGYAAVGALALVILLVSTLLAWWSGAGASEPIQATSS
jgi:predicted MFS family arabinose efflux permease